MKGLVHQDGGLAINGTRDIQGRLLEDVSAGDVVMSTGGEAARMLDYPTTGMPTAAQRSCGISPDGTYIATGSDASPFLYIYKRTGRGLVKLPDPATMPAGKGYGIAWSPDGTLLAVAHATTPFLTIYSVSGDTFTKLPDPATLPTGTAYKLSFSPDGAWLAVPHAASPFITIYSVSGNTFTAVANPATLPPDIGTQAAWSPDGTLLAVSHWTSPYVTIYQRSGSTFTKLPNPATLPTGTGNSVGFSPSGRYLAVGHAVGTSLRVYAISGTTFTACSVSSDIAPPATPYALSWFPEGDQFMLGTDGSGLRVFRYRVTGTVVEGLPTSTFQVNAVDLRVRTASTVYDASVVGDYIAIAGAFTNYVLFFERISTAVIPLPVKLGLSSTPTDVSTTDGTYWAVTEGGSVAVYKRTGDDFARLAYPAAPAGTPSAVAFSPNSDYLAVPHATTPFVTIYKRTGDTFAKLANPADLPPALGRSAAFSPDGVHLAIGHDTSPFVTIYKRTGDTFAKLANPGTLPAAAVRACAWSPDGTMLTCVGGISNPRMLTYSRSGDTFTPLAAPASVPGSGVNCTSVCYSPDGKFLLIGGDYSIFLYFYSVSGTTFTRITDSVSFFQQPSSTISRIGVSRDSRFVFGTTGTAVPRNWFRPLVNGGFGPAVPIPHDATGAVSGVAFSPVSDHIVVTGGPGLFNPYRIVELPPSEWVKPNPLFSTLLSRTGVATQSGTAGSTIAIKQIT